LRCGQGQRSKHLGKGDYRGKNSTTGILFLITHRLKPSSPLHWTIDSGCSGGANKGRKLKEKKRRIVYLRNQRTQHPNNNNSADPYVGQKGTKSCSGRGGKGTSLGLAVGKTEKKKTEEVTLSHLCKRPKVKL